MGAVMLVVLPIWRKTCAIFLIFSNLRRLPENDEDLLAAFGKMSAQDKPSISISAAEIDMEMDMMDEDTDEVSGDSYVADTILMIPQEALNPPPYSEYAHQPWVKYEIHLHQTYQTPCLWFELRDLPMGESPLDLEAVYRFLVPDEQKARLRALGVNGGISLGVSE